MPRDAEPHAPDDVRQIATWLDSAVRIPGTDWRVGLDPLLGLAPGLGDTVSSVLSGWIVVRAAGLGASPATLARMTGNVLVDALVGSVPVLGDMFDFGFKANQRNLALLEGHLADPARRRVVDRRLVIAVAVVAVLVPVGLAALVGWLVFAAVRAVGW
ncbi:DUF4112 domain-containing protein [Nannocystis sp. ILAH1]|uniref:DUF4112 domain-containing protein n=1 Tax=unclassified Nannocystis TaxID=2627009 RepID=UPI0022714E1E|nr:MULTISPECIES: DUF4112 domain-containing protein [unclassified Nannocystis]MCY0988552.1 DUF4112 domain-containing protein [Nannocystis sp. ILAH1]MCY1067485.1 DUF4112 domain-containing protein [Nannocystis sp. RBIL2]